MKRILIPILFIAALSALAADLGTVGKVYKIAEQDMMAEIEERASKVDWKAVLKRETENIKKKAGDANLKLPMAVKKRSFYLDMTYSLDHDINTYDQQGKITGVLYPKGFKYNPLDYIKVKETYVILNGNRNAEVDWFKKKYALTPLVYPLITEGNALQVAEKIGRPVYVLQDNMKKIFKLEHTVSIVYPEGRRMRVDEIAVNDEKNTSDNTTGNRKHK